MTNLENFGVQELNIKELETTDGGAIFLNLKVLKKVFEVLGVADALDQVGDGVIEGWNDRRN